MQLAKGDLVSSPLWIPLGVLVALLVGAALIWLTWRLVFARQRIFYSVLETPLIARRTAFSKQLRITYGTDDTEQEFTDPRVVRIRLISRSAKDIGTAAFNDHAPLVVDLGVPAVAILSDQDPGQPYSPAIGTQPSKIEIPPQKIRKGQIIIINVLVDGRPSVMVPKNHPLLDVDVAEKPWSAPIRPWWKYSNNLVAVVVVVLLCAATALTFNLI
jgi:hypothetical protein